MKKYIVSVVLKKAEVQISAIGVFFFIIYLVILSSILYSCEEATKVGLDFIETEPLHTYYIDTATVRISTVTLDSIVTSGGNRMMVGHHNDERLGPLRCSSFFHVSWDAVEAQDPDEESASFDSLELVLNYDGFWYYDTTEVVTFSLYQLKNELDYLEDTIIYNTTKDFYYKDYPEDTSSFLGKLSFKPRPSDENITISVDEDFGKYLFDMILAEDERISSSTRFNRELKGFVLVPDSVNGPVLGFSTSSKFVMYYNQPGDDELSENSHSFDIPIEGSVHYNQIIADRSSSGVAGLTSRKYCLDSYQSDNTAFIQGGLGLGVRVDFPYIKNFRELSKYVVISSANLYLYPIAHSYDDNAYLPATLSVAELNKANIFISSYYDDGATLYMDDEFHESTTYHISLQEYIHGLVNDPDNEGEGLFLGLDSSEDNETVVRLYFGDQKSEFKVKLGLVILSIDPDSI